VDEPTLMPWNNARPGGNTTAPKYRTPEYRAAVKRLRAQLARDGTGLCAEIVCHYRTRTITPDMDLHACHDRRTGQIRGLGHAHCNRTEGARYARAKQSGQTRQSALRW
jgi:hypothetical protein